MTTRLHGPVASREELAARLGADLARRRESRRRTRANRLRRVREGLPMLSAGVRKAVR